jgi:hypothetical protein
LNEVIPELVVPGKISATIPMRPWPLDGVMHEAVEASKAEQLAASGSYIQSSFPVYVVPVPQERSLLPRAPRGCTNPDAPAAVFISCTREVPAVVPSLIHSSLPPGVVYIPKNILSPAHVNVFAVPLNDDKSPPVSLMRLTNVISVVASAYSSEFPWSPNEAVKKTPSPQATRFLPLLKAPEIRRVPLLVPSVRQRPKPTFSDKQEK